MRQNTWRCSFPWEPFSAHCHRDIHVTRERVACEFGGACRVVCRVSGDSLPVRLEHEDGRPKEFKAKLADPQQLFVDFVREQTELTLVRMGLLAPVFDGVEYACQARVTAAYMIHRENLRHLAFGYRNRDSDYVREKLEDHEDWLDNARAIRPFANHLRKII